MPLFYGRSLRDRTGAMIARLDIILLIAGNCGAALIRVFSTFSIEVVTQSGA